MGEVWWAPCEKPPGTPGDIRVVLRGGWGPQMRMAGECHGTRSQVRAAGVQAQESLQQLPRCHDSKTRGSDSRTSSAKASGGPAQCPFQPQAAVAPTKSKGISGRREKGSPGPGPPRGPVGGASWNGARQPELRPCPRRSPATLVISVMKGSPLGARRPALGSGGSAECHVVPAMPSQTDEGASRLPGQDRCQQPAPARPRGAVWDVFKDALLSAIKYASPP